MAGGELPAALALRDDVADVSVDSRPIHGESRAPFGSFRSLVGVVESEEDVAAQTGRNHEPSSVYDEFVVDGEHSADSPVGPQSGRYVVSVIGESF